MTGGGRSDADHALVAALAAGATRNAAAKAAGISTRTLRRRMDDPDFVDLLAAHRADTLARCADRLATATTTAVAALVDLLDDDDTPPAVRVAAARTVLDHAVRYVDTVDHSVRLDRLEHLAERNELRSAS